MFPDIAACLRLEYHYLCTDLIYSRQLEDKDSSFFFAFCDYEDGTLTKIIFGYLAENPRICDLSRGFFLP